MTPFHIRKRLRELVAGSRKTRVERDEFEVEFILPDGSSHRVRTEAHYSLHMASQMLATPIDAPCPDGHCGDCQVRILDDRGLAPPSATEAKILDEKLGPERDPSIRLACHARLTGPGVRVQVNKVWDLASMR